MDREIVIRFCFLLGFFVAIAIWETLSPRRNLLTSKKRRWSGNLVLLCLNPISVRLIFPLLPVSMSLLAEEHHWGLLNSITMPYWLKVAMGVIVLDLAIYLQHVLHHAIPLLWRLHMVHHSDLDFDVTTGVRFHPIEIAVSMGIKLTAVAALGPPALAVLIFEVALNATSLFNHSNIRISKGVDRLLRLFVVTPDMHRVHHSVILRETNSNFGLNLPWWDHLFGTYKDQPDMGHELMTIGISQFRNPEGLSLSRLIILPFVEDPGGIPINRH